MSELPSDPLEYTLLPVEPATTGDDVGSTASADLERPGGLLSAIAPNVVMYHDSHSVLAEQYRQCRTNLTALNRSGAPWVIVVASSRKGEGKSVTVANLAVSLAELPGTRVCLLDADSRSPQAAGYFGLRPRCGLTECLRDGAPFQDALQATLIDNLDCIHAGETASNPSELLGSDRFGALIDELRRRYSWILIDTPPVNPFTDAAVVSARANGTLLVVRLQETPRALVNATIDSLTTAGGKVLGTFVTGMTPDQDDAAQAILYRGAATAPGEVAESAAERRRRRRAERARLRREKALLKKRGRAAQRPDDDPYPV